MNTNINLEIINNSNNSLKNLKISKVSNYLKISKPKTTNLSNGIIIPGKLKNI